MFRPLRPSSGESQKIEFIFQEDFLPNRSVVLVFYNKLLQLQWWRVCSEMSGRDRCPSQCAVGSSPQLGSLSPPMCHGKPWKSARQARPCGCPTTLSTAAWVVTRSSGSADESITAGEDTQDTARTKFGTSLCYSRHYTHLKTFIACTMATLIQYSCI
jgi:hypothetical protein